MLGLLIYPKFINYLKRKDYNQKVSEYALEEYKLKAKTPIMGGLLFVIIPSLVVLCLSLFLFNDIKNLWILAAFFGFGMVGFADDFTILIKGNNDGLSPKSRLIAELLIVTVMYLFLRNTLATTIHFPIINLDLDLKFLYFVLLVVMYLGEANACNFNDGMDGLCAGCSSISLLVCLIVAINQQNTDIMLIIVSVLGGLLAYLVFNWHPAKIFMGDSGSLALGALFAGIAMSLKIEVPIIIICGTFLVEMGTVIIQRTYYKIYHRRLFTYTPIHYAFVKRGAKEVNVVLGFYVLTAVFGILGYLLTII